MIVVVLVARRAGGDVGCGANEAAHVLGDRLEPELEKATVAVIVGRC